MDSGPLCLDAQKETVQNLYGVLNAAVAAAERFAGVHAFQLSTDNGLVFVQESLCRFLHHLVAFTFGLRVIHISVGNFHSDYHGHRADRAAGAHAAHAESEGFCNPEHLSRVSAHNIAVGAGDGLRTVEALFVKPYGEFFSVHIAYSPLSLDDRRKPDGFSIPQQSTDCKDTALYDIISAYRN